MKPIFTEEQKKAIQFELYQAYYDCRRNKRNTLNAIAFEIEVEHNLHVLYNELIEGTYTPGRSVVFIVTNPVVREIFAADFRDRVIHHFIINRLNRYLERMFIYDSYSCRVGKGTLFGIGRAEHFMRACSDNYTRDCYVCKLDIQGFFMHIKRQTLLDMINSVISQKCPSDEKELLYELCRKVVLQDPARDCIVRGGFDEWEKLPRSKSLFHMPPGQGLPIGNLTSQLFANLYLNGLDHYVKRTLKAKYYGRYVDDIILFSRSKEQLKEWRTGIDNYLRTNLDICLHPAKQYLQHYSKGVTFLGAHIMPHRRYIGNRTVKNLNKLLSEKAWMREVDLISGKGIESRQSKITSYTGLMQHFRTYRMLMSKGVSHNDPLIYNPACRYLDGPAPQSERNKRV